MTRALRRGAVGLSSSPQLERVKAETTASAITEKRVKFFMASSIRCGVLSCVLGRLRRVRSPPASTGNGDFDEPGTGGMRNLHRF